VYFNPPVDEALPLYHLQILAAPYLQPGRLLTRIDGLLTSCDSVHMQGFGANIPVINIISMIINQVAAEF